MAKSEKHVNKQAIIDSGYFEFRAEQWVGVPLNRKEQNVINVKLHYDPEEYRAIVYRSYTSGYPNPSWNGIPEYSVFYSDTGNNLGVYQINGYCKNWNYDSTLIAKDRWVEAVLYNDPRDFQLGGNLEHGTRDDYWSSFRLEGGQPLDGDYNFHIPESPAGVILDDSTARFNAFATFREDDLDVAGAQNHLDEWKPLNCIISENKEGIYEYLHGGELPDDAELVGADGTTDDGDDGDEEDDTDTTTENLPAVTVYSSDGACNYYALNSGNLTAFINWMWYDMLDLSEIILNTTTKIYNNIANNIESIRLFPLSVEDTTKGNSPIILGRTISELSVPTIKHQYKFTHSTFTLNGKVKNAKQFYGYEPYATCQIYLPFVGFRDFPLDLWGARLTKDNNGNYSTKYPTCKVKYGVDFRTGMGVCQLWRDFDGGSSLIDEYDCQLAIDIPYSTETGYQLVSNLVGAFTDVMPEAKTMKSILSMSKAGDSILNSVTNVGNAETSTAKSNGSRNSMNGLYNPFDVYVIMRYSVVDLEGDSLARFNHTYGRACMQSRLLNDLNGFTICENVDITFGNTTVKDGDKTVKVSPTQNEWAEIKTLLESGVYL